MPTAVQVQQGLLHPNEILDKLSNWVSSVEPHLRCPLCGDIVTDAHVDPECMHRYCRSCIKHSLSECDDECLNIHASITSHHNLRRDEQFETIKNALCEIIKIIQHGKLSMHTTKDQSQQEYNKMSESLQQLDQTPMTAPPNNNIKQEEQQPELSQHNIITSNKRRRKPTSKMEQYNKTLNAARSSYDSSSRFHYSKKPKVTDIHRSTTSPSSNNGTQCSEGGEGGNSIFRVTIPPNVSPNQNFQVYAGSHIVRVRCPPNTRPGQMVQITVPNSNDDPGSRQEIKQEQRSEGTEEMILPSVLSSVEGDNGDDGDDDGAVGMNSDARLSNTQNNNDDDNGSGVPNNTIPEHFWRNTTSPVVMMEQECSEGMILPAVLTSAEDDGDGGDGDEAVQMNSDAPWFNTQNNNDDANGSGGPTNTTPEYFWRNTNGPVVMSEKPQEDSEDIIDDVVWLSLLEDFKEYMRNNNGSMDIRRKENKKLYNWSHGNRQRYKQSASSPKYYSPIMVQRKAFLDQINFFAKKEKSNDEVKDEKWLKMYEKLKLFQQENGSCIVPTTDKTLRGWINSQLRVFKYHPAKAAIPKWKYRQELLEQIDFFECFDKKDV